MKKVSSFVDSPAQTGNVQAIWGDPDGPVGITEAVIEGIGSVMVRRVRVLMGEMGIGGMQVVAAAAKFASSLFAWCAFVSWYSGEDGGAFSLSSC